MPTNEGIDAVGFEPVLADVPTWLQAVSDVGLAAFGLVVPLAYLFGALRRVYGQSRVRAFFKTSGLQVTYFLLLVATIVLILESGSSFA